LDFRHFLVLRLNFGVEFGCELGSGLGIGLDDISPGNKQPSVGIEVCCSSATDFSMSICSSYDSVFSILIWLPLPLLDMVVETLRGYSLTWRRSCAKSSVLPSGRYFREQRVYRAVRTIRSLCIVWMLKPGELL
jgi:hypothetical protein